jgi:hypothetical protein
MKAIGRYPFLAGWLALLLASPPIKTAHENKKTANTNSLPFEDN